MVTGPIVYAGSPRPNPAEPVPKIVLSLGMGADSAALLTRWLTDPSSRDFNLADLLVITAMVGDEWDQTRQLMQDHLLPLMAAHQVRYVQVARAGRTALDGARILSDSRATTTLEFDGDYKLSDELLGAGTVAQAGGARLCSVHSKGIPLDLYLAAETGGVPFRHAIGFESGEARRAARDRTVPAKKGLNRVPEYPLIDWDWDRAACEQFLTAQFAVEWAKSACISCPFSFGTRAGRDRMIAAYQADPAVGARAAYLEHVALCLNPAQGLLAGDRLADLLAETCSTTVLDALEARLANARYAVYEVRRVFTRRSDGKYNAARDVRALAFGTREQMTAALTRYGPVDAADGIGRVWLRRRHDGDPVTGEQFYVAAPAEVADKQGPAFAAGWAKLTEQALFDLPAPLAATA